MDSVTGICDAEITWRSAGTWCANVTTTVSHQFLLDPPNTTGEKNHKSEQDVLEENLLSHPETKQSKG